MGLRATAILLALLAVRAVQGSEGDASETFTQCHASCMRTGCTRTPGPSNTCLTTCPGARFHAPPLSLRLMQWDCAADCSYQCMWAIEGPKAAAAAGPVWKYFGKWPFIRVAGVQEMASVLFSLANLLAHAHNLLRYVSYMRSCTAGAVKTSPLVSSGGGRLSNSGSRAAQPYPYYWLWLVYGAVNINAWLWSSVFHCRDTRCTERLDYFSADLTVAVGLAVAIARSLQLQTPSSLALLALLMMGGLSQHVYYMAFIKFDYGYNMKLCIAAGVLTAAIWLAWVTAVRHPGRRVVYVFMLLVHCAMLLEVLDFPPLLWLFDAHALWHAATVPLTYLWYRFVFADVAWLAGGPLLGGPFEAPQAAAGKLV